MFDGVKFEVFQLYLSFFLSSAFCPLPSALPQPRSPKVAKNLNVSQQFSCLQAGAFMFASRNRYQSSNFT
jgi:hypothetical protein